MPLYGPRLWCYNENEPTLISASSSGTTAFVTTIPLFLKNMIAKYNQLLQLCSVHIVFLILVTVRLYTVMLEVCCWLTNEKQRKTDIRLTVQ